MFFLQESAQVQVTDFNTISGDQKPDGRLDFTYTYTETASAAEQVEIYLVLLENATTSYVDELIKENAGSSDECKQSVKNCQSSIPESSTAPLQDKVKEKLVKIQEIEIQLRTNFYLCFSLRTTPPPTCVTGKENILKDLAEIISKNEMSKLKSLLKDAINCVKAYLDSCVKH